MPISLQKGQKVSLTKGNPGLTKVVVGLGWDVNSFDTGGDFDLDAAAFLLGESGKVTSSGDFVFYRSSLADPMFYVRLFGHVLGHADFDHFLGNMLLLLVIGPPLEEKYGSRTLLAGILLTAGVSGILQCVFFPGSALLGASGIVFMLIMLASLAGMKDGRIPLTLILAAVLYLGQEVYAMVALRDNVANFMHLVGGVTGTVFGVVLAKRR